MFLRTIVDSIELEYIKAWSLILSGFLISVIIPNLDFTIYWIETVSKILGILAILFGAVMSAATSMKKYNALKDQIKNNKKNNHDLD